MNIFRTSYSRKFYWLYSRLKAGIKAIVVSRKKQGILILYLAIVLITWVNRITLWGSEYASRFERALLYLGLNAYYIIGLVAILLIFGQTIKDYLLQKQLLRIGMVNSLGEVPILLEYMEHIGQIKVTFDSAGIPVTKWEDKVLELENSLDMSISRIELKGNNHIILIEGCRGILDYSEKIVWEKQYQTYDSILRLGECMRKPVYLDLQKHSHILIGGATGSGKTWLLKLILLQCINKQYQVFIADFKGGIDYPSVWHKRCKFVVDENDALACLVNLCNEIRVRQTYFQNKECRNLDMYNHLTGDNLPTIVFSCDEIGELLDTTGLEKDQKEIRKQIAGKINTIARLGRAFGIHLVLATQRPDAEILSGQTKNNITYRICGRADNVLSRIILDISDASDRIPTDAEGVFLNQDGIVFKSYVLNETKDFLV